MPAIESKFIGYFPKRTEPLIDWTASWGIMEICSVSNCIFEGPKNWIQQWRHNEHWMFSTPDLAWSVVPEEERAEFQILGYKMLSVKITLGVQAPYLLPEPTIDGPDESFTSLGFDIVSRSTETTFDCSPLSCNGLAKEVPVNRHCLLPTAETAIEVAMKLEEMGGEPGPYYIVEVLRQNLTPA